MAIYKFNLHIEYGRPSSTISMDGLAYYNLGNQKLYDRSPTWVNLGCEFKWSTVFWIYRCCLVLGNTFLYGMTGMPSVCGESPRRA